ncbi:MAG: OB-fold domain-containing protein [Actinobacteria bacterium]|nr:OB-fold domain-containing protein [Actinomycetota bacterium]
MTGISAWGAYIPALRLERSLLGKAWGTPALPGARTVRAGDEDSLTMGVEAALTCLGDRARDDIDAVFFATTTPPYAEKHAAATIAAVLGLRDAMTSDVTGSLRAGAAALRGALDAVDAGTARTALVVAADNRPAEPATAMEQLFGDGAAAVLVTKEAAVEIVSRASNAEDFTGPWRRPGDSYVKTFDPKLETEYGYIRPVGAAAKKALGERTAGAIVGYAPDPRTLAQLSKKLGIEARDALFKTAGNLGAAHALVALAAALDDASVGDRLLLVAQGEGADAFVLEVRASVTSALPVRDQLAAGAPVPTYESYLRSRRLLPSDAAEPKSSTITYWRDRAQALPLIGVRCGNCGTVQFPANRACYECSVFDQMAPVSLQRTGTIFTFTLDHLLGGEYLETPLPRVVVDLDGGGRIFLEMTEVDPSSVAIGDRIEMTFRLLHDGAGFHNYYWKARPPRRAPVRV